jgi:Integrase core domain.
LILFLKRNGSKNRGGDIEIIPFILFLEEGKLPDDKKLSNKVTKLSVSFVMDDNMIFRNTKIRRSDKSPTKRIWVPSTMRKIVLTEIHDSLWSGAHMGSDKTLAKLNAKYYFNGMTRYVKLWCRTCSICQRTKRPHPRKNKVTLGEIKVSKPYELFCIDIWDPCVKSDRGNTCVLTVVDAFTKFAWAIPIKDEKSETIAIALLQEILSHFPHPDKIHSDRGENLIGEIMDALKFMCGIEKSMTTAWHPSGNAYAERIHQFFRNAITSYIAQNQRDWDIILPIVLRSYLDAIHDSLDGLAPSELVFGRKLGSDLIPIEEDRFKSKKLFVQRLNLALSRAQESILQFRHKKRDKALSKSKISKLMKSDLKAGDLVTIKVRSISDIYESDKLFVRQRGPFTISRVSQEGRVIRILDPITKEEHPVPLSREEVSRFHSRKGTILEDSSSSKEDSDRSSSGPDEIESMDDFHLSSDSDEQSDAENSDKSLVPRVTTRKRTLEREAEEEHKKIVRKLQPKIVIEELNAKI